MKSDTVIKMRRKIMDELGLHNKLPEDIKISTMTLEGRFNTSFSPWNIYKYIRRSDENVINVVKGNKLKKYKPIRDTEENDIINQNIKKKTKNKDNHSKIFLNQVTISINVNGKKNKKPVSVKIFNCGTIHFTGCVDIDNMIEATYKLCIECKQETAIFGSDGKIKDIKFAENLEELKLENMYGFKVDMINCIFIVPFKIDRPKLQILLTEHGYNAIYDSNGHAGVKIKYISLKNKITIFVFESGSIIIILGNQGFEKIKEVYDFIYKYLLENYEAIVKNDDYAKVIIQKYIDKEIPIKS